MNKNYEETEICPKCRGKLKVDVYTDPVFNDTNYHYSCPHCGWDEDKKEVLNYVW